MSGPDHRSSQVTAQQRMVLPRFATITQSMILSAMDVVDLRNFYAQRLGTVARRFIGRGIRTRWSDSTRRGSRVSAMPRPIRSVSRGSRALLALMPATQGVVRWPSARPALAALVEEYELPSPMHRSTACRWCMRSKCRGPGRSCCAKLGGAAGAASCLRWGPTGGAMGANHTTPFGHGGPYRGGRSPTSCAIPGSRRSDGARRSTCRRSPRGWFLRSAVAWDAPVQQLGAIRRRASRRGDQAPYRAMPARRERRRRAGPATGADPPPGPPRYRRSMANGRTELHRSCRSTEAADRRRRSRAEKLGQAPFRRQRHQQFEIARGGALFEEPRRAPCAEAAAAGVGEEPAHTARLRNLAGGLAVTADREFHDTPRDACRVRWSAFTFAGCSCTPKHSVLQKSRRVRASRR